MTQQEINNMMEGSTSRDNVRRSKRILDQLAESGSSTEMICDSYVITSATGVPSPGLSQDALEVMHTLNKTPATTPATTPAKLQGNNNDEEG